MYYIKRWPLNRFVSETVSPKKVNSHPKPDPALASNAWDGDLLFAGTECDLNNPGLMEGALPAAIRVADTLLFQKGHN